MNKKCKHLTCTEIAISNSQYCQEHTHLTPKRQKRIYSEHSLYNTAGWKALSQQIRNKHPICQRCNHQLSAVADHIYEIRLPNGMKYSMHEQNIQALCHSCHNIKTQKVQKSLRIGIENETEIIECTEQTFRILRNEVHTAKQLSLLEEIERKYKKTREGKSQG